jgi:cholesterol transport system auxiliary component
MIDTAVALQNRPRMRARGFAFAGLAAAIVALGGCASLLGGGKPPATYDLTAPSNLPKSSGGRGNLIVAEPVAVAVIDGQRIVVKPSAGEVTYLPDAQWSDRLPKLVQARMIETFENANRLRSVGRPGDRLSVDYQLISELRAFEIDAATGQATVEFTAKIVNDKTGKIVAGEVFTARRPVGGALNGSAASLALNGALGETLTALVVWAGKRS